MENLWRRCSSCKKPIGLSAKYYQCSVSTCNGPRTGYVFCTVACWEVHLPGARHKDAAAIEHTAPKTPPAPSEGSRRIVAAAATPASTSAVGGGPAREILIVASRLKDYIQAKADFNTSAGVMERLSDFVRVACDHAIDNARADGRKTVLDRDFSFLGKL